MPDPSNALLRQYVKLTDFLGPALGPDYEVVLHDLSNGGSSVIAIANGHISGREIGARLTGTALGTLLDRSCGTQDWWQHRTGLSAGGRPLRSSTLFIREGGQPVGALCINFDDARYQALAQDLLALCRSDGLLRQARDLSQGDICPEPPHDAAEAAAQGAIHRELERLGVPAERLTSGERLQVIITLEESGIFLLKGSVKDVAAGLRCSQASIYRYLTQIRREAVR